MKKVFLWIGLVLLSPVLLFLLLTLLIYMPPVQRWVVGQVTAYATEATGMQVSVSGVSLQFPLDLSIHDFLVVEDHDTVASVARFVVDVQLMPLVEQEVLLNACELNDAKVNTSDMIASARVKGSLKRLALLANSRGNLPVGIHLQQQSVAIGNIILDGARLDVALSDTVPPDTSTTPTLWKIAVDELKVSRSLLSLHLPGDTLQLDATLNKAMVYQTHIDLGDARYTVGRLDLSDGALAFNNHYEPTVQGFDPNHIALSSICLQIDSVLYRSIAPKDSSSQGGQIVSLSLRELRLREKSGLVLSHAEGNIAMDTLRLSVPSFRLLTPSSTLSAEMKMDLNAFNEHHPGQLFACVDAAVSKEDVHQFVGIADARVAHEYRNFFARYPDHPLTLKLCVDGNLQQAYLRTFDFRLPTAFEMTAEGKAIQPMDAKKIKGQLSLRAKTHNLSFLMGLLPRSVASSYRIPSGISLDAKAVVNGPHYDLRMMLREGEGSVKTEAKVNTDVMAYQAQMDIHRLNLHHFMPKDSLRHLTAQLTLSGRGTDIRSKHCLVDLQAELQQLEYGSWLLDQVHAVAGLKDGVGHLTLDSHNALLDGHIGLDALLSKQRVEATLGADVRKADLYQLRVMDRPFEVGVCAHIDMSSDLEQTHRLLGTVNDLTIRDEAKTYRPTSLDVDILTCPDTTWAKVNSGDFFLDLAASGGVEQLSNQGNQLLAQLQDHVRQRIIDQNSLRALLPVIKMQMNSGQENPVAAFLRMNGLTFKDLAFSLDASPEKGINGRGILHSLVYDSTRIDTIEYHLVQTGTKLTFNGHVENNKKNPQFVFKTLFDGELLERGAQLNVTYYDADNVIGAQLGAKAEMCDSGLYVHLLPYRPILGYKEFNLNHDNFVFMGANRKIQAKIDLIADDGTGVKIYSEDQDPTMLQDITVSLNKFDLAKLTSVLPYAPRMSGLLNGDFHILLDADERISMLSDMSIAEMTYEQCPMGNLSTEFVYLQRGDSAHYVEARINRNDMEIGVLNGSYRPEGKGWLDATFTMERFPLSLANGFVPDQLIGLEGYADGKVAICGPLSAPDVDGEVYLDSSYLVSVPYGMRLRFDNDPVRIVNSKLLLENFTMYAYNDNPLTLYGHIDFSNLDRVMVDMKMRARNFQLINAKKNRRSLVYGKTFVNFGGTANGRIDRLKMRGQLDVLGTTNMTYILKDSPLSTDDQLKELVTFTDFRDTTGVAAERPVVEGLDMLLLMNIEQGARIVCALNAAESNYVNLEGGGELRMVYNSTDELQLFGRYTLNQGEMKYELPIIPLKTFTIKEGSYIEFNGDIMNPRLNLTATEQVKALVGAETTGSRSVNFECGVKVTQTLANMGLEFTLDAPDDMSVKNELAAMGVEQRGKLAVTMLTTGMYLADGNTSGFSMNSALNSFLQSEINNITKSAMRTVDLSLGLDQSSDASGNTHTDYSFKFAKRFWNNRFNFVVGGKLSNSENNEQDQSFIDNVSLEYRLDQSAMRYVRMFYNKEADDLLEGRISEYGAGFVWRKKMDKLHQLFDIRSKTLYPDNSTSVK